MGTTGIVHFLGSADATPTATVILHDDGYPEGEQGVELDLLRFFSRIEEQSPKDKRWLDPAVLAARYVIWLGVWESTIFDKDPLAVNGVSIEQGALFDAEYTYYIHCYQDAINGTAGRPKVTWTKN